MNTLVIVSCGKAKIWNRDPSAGPTPARNAYTGGPFVVNREYADRFASKWVILSAMYGFVAPDFLIDGDYDVSFGDLRSKPISTAHLREQVEAQMLYSFDLIIGLGGKHYRNALESAFDQHPVDIVYPVAGYPPGVAMRHLKTLITIGKPLG